MGMKRPKDETFLETGYVACTEAGGPLGPYHPKRWIEVSRFTPENDDGRDAIVEHVCYPAQFFRVRWVERANGVTTFGLATGSGSECGRLARDIAKALAAGMLRIEDVEGAD